MPPPKERIHVRRDHRSRSRSPYSKRTKYYNPRSRSRSPRHKTSLKKQSQPRHQGSYSPPSRNRAPSSKSYSSKKRSPSPYRRNPSPPRPRTSLQSSRQRDKSDRSGKPEQKTRERSPIYTGSSRDRFNLPQSHRRSWSPEQPMYHQDPMGGRRSPSPRVLNQEPSSLLFPAAKTIIAGPITIPESHTGGQKMTLNNRFGVYDDIELPLIIEDNITIGIHRRGPHMIHDPRRPIIRNFRSTDVLEIHRKDEGKYPLFDREEIKVFRHDEILDDEVYEERRTISLLQPSKPRHQRDLYESDRRIIQRPGKDSRQESGLYVEPEIRFDPRPDPRYEGLLRENAGTSFRDKAKVSRVQRNPNDLRHSLLKRRHDDDEEDFQFDARKKIEAKRKDSHREEKPHSRERQRDRSGDRRHQDDVIRSSDSRHRQQDRQQDRQQERQQEKEVLPDFSNRPGRKDADRYQVDEWKDKPEMIPKNPMYYEHDNREGSDGYRERYRSNRPFKARGFSTRTFTRGSYRGNYKGNNFIPNYRARGFRRPYNNSFRGRGRGSYYSDSHRKSTSGDRVWKHDLYEDVNKPDNSGNNQSSSSNDKLEDNREDNKPSSTT